MTISERRLWTSLRARKMDGWKFRRQHPIGNYIVDFACPAARLIVELDGSSHDDEVSVENGKRRQAWLESQGYKVLRFRADYPDADPIDGVAAAIYLHLQELEPASPPAL